MQSNVSSFAAAHPVEWAWISGNPDNNFAASLAGDEADGEEGDE